MKDAVVDEVRRIRKQIEAEHGNDWDGLEAYLKKIGNRHKVKLYHGSPRPLPKLKHKAG